MESHTRNTLLKFYWTRATQDFSINPSVSDPLIAVTDSSSLVPRRSLLAHTTWGEISWRHSVTSRHFAPSGVEWAGGEGLGTRLWFLNRLGKLARTWFHPSGLSQSSVRIKTDKLVDSYIDFYHLPHCPFQVGEAWRRKKKDHRGAIGIWATASG